MKKIFLYLLGISMLTLIGCSENKINTQEKVVQNLNNTESKKEYINENVKNPKGFIFENSHKKLISKEELATCDKFTLTLARNEIFARKGYVFKNKDYSTYFKNMDWYTPDLNYKDSSSNLNSIEKENLELINKEFNNFYYSVDEKNKLNIVKDLNNDGNNEKINISFKKDPENYSWEEYHLNITSGDKNYTLSNSEIGLHNRLFFADFDVNDNTIEFYLTSAGPSGDPATIIFQLSDNKISEILRLDGYITSYDGNGNIYTEYSSTNDKNKVLISYYNLKNGIQHPKYSEVIGKYLNYKYPLIIFKSKDVSPCFSYFTDNYDDKAKELLPTLYKEKDLVKISNINEPLKIIYVDYDHFKDSIKNIPIQVETKEGMKGWLLHLNGGD